MWVSGLVGKLRRSVPHNSFLTMSVPLLVGMWSGMKTPSSA